MDYLPHNPSPLTDARVAEMNPVTLAFIGDGVHTLYVRFKTVEEAQKRPRDIHKAVCESVNAAAQAARLDACLERLSQEEYDMFKRGRNAHVHSVAKNASVADYKKATGFEALIGYLWLTGRHARLSELLDETLEDGAKTVKP